MNAYIQWWCSCNWFLYTSYHAHCFLNSFTDNDNTHCLTFIAHVTFLECHLFIPLQSFRCTASHIWEISKHFTECIICKTRNKTHLISLIQINLGTVSWVHINFHTIKYSSSFLRHIQFMKLKAVLVPYSFLHSVTSVKWLCYWDLQQSFGISATLWAIKTCHFVFDYNSSISWSFFNTFCTSGNNNKYSTQKLTKFTMSPW